MSLRRSLVGFAVLLTVVGWSSFRPGGRAAQAGQPTVSATSDGNHDDQERRFRTNQPRHWKHVMVGTR